MADSRRSPPADAVVAAIGAALGERQVGERLAVAFSGGRDSVALLDACATAATNRGQTVHAIHVHHGLAAHADAWAQFCLDRCHLLGIPLHIRRIGIVVPHRDGVEAAARSGRYGALAEAARSAGIRTVLLAHHQDDQAETVLLQLARGAGPHGLGGMPRIAERDGILWIRPLIGVPRHAIDAYVRSHELSFVEDPSNGDARHRRNAVRQAISPAFARTFPGYPGTVARAAMIQAESAQLQDELAAIDAAGAIEAGAMHRARLRELSDARARNLLRWFLRANGLRAPSAARLAEMLRQLRGAAHDARVCIAHDGRELGVHRDRIVVHDPVPARFALEWHGESEIELPHGELRFAGRIGDGVALSRLSCATVMVKPREGGERLRPMQDQPSRSLKHLLQEAGVPPWARDGWPLVFCDGALAAIPGIGIDAAWRAHEGAPGLVPEWRERRPARCEGTR